MYRKLRNFHLFRNSFRLARFFFALIFFSGIYSNLLAKTYPLYIPQDENITYYNPDYLVDNAIELRITDYPNSSELLPSIPYPPTVQEDGCVFLQNTLFNLISGQSCFNSCGNMCYSSCSGGCGESCGGPVKWYAAQAVEGMYLTGYGDAANILDCHFPYEYRIKVRGCSDGWFPESNCGNPADCTGISFINTGLSLTSSNPGGFPGGFDPAMYATIDLFTFEIDINAYGRIYGNWQGCGCVWYRPWCCAAEAVCEAISISDTLMNRHVTSNPVDEKAILKAYTQDMGNGQTKVGFNLPWSQTTLNNFNVNIFNWSCDIWGWNPCQDLANWLNGLISNWIRSTVENAVDDAIRNELGSGFEYILDIPPNGTNPFDIVVAPTVQGGLDFVSEQLRQGLEGDLKNTLVESFEGFQFAENNYYVTDLAGCAIYADFNVIVRGCYDQNGNIKPLDSPFVGCYWASDGFTQLHPGGDPQDADGLTYQRTGVNLTSDPAGFTQIDNALYTTLQLYDLELDVDAYFTVRFAPGDPYCNWIGNYAFPQRTGVVNATAKGIAQTIFNGTSIALDFTGFQLNVNDLYLAAVNWSCCAPSQTNCQWDVCRDISSAANLFLSSYAATLLGDMINQEIDSLLNSFFDKNGDGVPDPLFDLNDLLAEIPLGDIGLRLGFSLNLETSPQPPFGATLSANAGLFPSDTHPCVPLATHQGLEYTESPPPVFTDFVPGFSPDKPYMIAAELSDDFVNQLLFTLYSAGFLCIDIDPASKELINIAGKPLDQFLRTLGLTGNILPPDVSNIVSTLLNTNTFAFFLPDLWEYAPNSPIKIVLRPSAPPVVRFGVGGDTLRITLRDFNIDLYTQMEGRDIRVLSFKTGVGMGFTINSINLMSTTPNVKLIDLTVSDPQIESALTFNEIIPIREANLEAVIVNLMRLAAPLLTGLLSGLDPILTPPGVNPAKPEGDLFGLTIENTYLVTDVPSPNGLYYNYLGLFMNLGGNLCWSCLLQGFSLSLPLSPSPQLNVSMLNPPPLITSYVSQAGGLKQLSSSSVAYATFTKPEAEITLSEPEGVSGYRYSYRIDYGLWSNYIDTNSVRIKNLLEGTHIIDVRAKDRNGTLSENSSIIVRVDSLPPRINVRKSYLTDDLVIDVADIQTNEELIQTSYRWDSGEWTEPSTERRITTGGIAPGIHTLEIKATDDTGNTGIFTTTVEITEFSGCGCNTQSGRNGNLYSLLLVFFSAGIIRLFRKILHPYS